MTTRSISIRDEFGADRVFGTISTLDNNGLVTIKRRQMRPARVGIFVTTENVATGVRTGRLVNIEGMYLEGTARALIRNVPELTEPARKPDISIVSYNTYGFSSVLEGGPDFIDSDRPLILHRVRSFQQRSA